MAPDRRRASAHSCSELANREFHAVVVAEQTPEAIAALRGVKLGDALDDVDLALLSAAKVDFALILAPPSLSFVLSEDDISFVDAVLRVDTDLLFRLALA